jgi:hypothetical protein
MRFIDSELDGDFQDSIKLPDAALEKKGSLYPLVVVEVGISETTQKLHGDGEKWLGGTDGHTKLVILVDINEKRRRQARRDNWDLAPEDFRTMSHCQLFDHIFGWYQSRNISLIGEFDMCIHFWYKDGVRQRAFEANFSPTHLISLDIIEDFPLRTDYLIPGANTNEQLLFPLRYLVSKLQDSFPNLEMKRASKLAKEERKRRLESGLGSD